MGGRLVLRLLCFEDGVLYMRWDSSVQFRLKQVEHRSDCLTWGGPRPARMGMCSGGLGAKGRSVGGVLLIRSLWSWAAL